MQVLMTTQPAFSHAAQMIPLARALARRGHAVTVATSAPFVGKLRALGVDARPFGPDWEVRPGDELYDQTVGQHSFFGFPMVPDQSSLEDLMALARDTAAQLIVREYSEFTAWAVAGRLELPLLTGAAINAANAPARDLRGPLTDPDTLDAGEIANALTRLLDDREFARAAQRLATEIDAMPEPDQTADLLERLAASQPPVIRSAG